MHPGQPLVDNWHIAAISEHLEACSDRQIRKLIINIPPGHAKSYIVSVFWPAWEWLQRPWAQSLFGSYDRRLALRDSARSRRLMGSAWYQDWFRPEWKFDKRQDSKEFFANSMNGHRFSFGVRSQFKTGWRGDKVVVDDPLSAKHRYNRQIKAECLETWNVELSTRVLDPATGVFVVIMQRLADDDLTGHMLAEGGWEHLCLPSEFDRRRRFHTTVMNRETRQPWTDPRKDDGELLFGAKFTREELDYLKTHKLGYDDYDSQHQQNPHPEKGARFNKQYFQHWRYVGTDRNIIRLFNRDGTPGKLVRLDQCRTFVSVDVAVSEKRQADYTVYGIWAVTPAHNLVLIDRVKGRMTEPESIAAAKQIYAWRGRNERRHQYFAVEGNGVGKPLYQQMKNEGLPVKEITVSTDKMVMSTTAKVRIEAGQVYFPDPATTDWYGDFETTLIQFPAGAHDDDVTMLSLAAEEVYGDDVFQLGAAPLGPRQVGDGEGNSRQRRGRINERMQEMLGKK